MEDEEEVVEPPEGRVAFSATRPQLEAEEVVEDPEDVEGLEEDVVADSAEAVVDTKAILKSIFQLCLVFEYLITSF